MKRRTRFKHPKAVVVTAAQVCEGWLVKADDDRYSRWREVTAVSYRRDGMIAIETNNTSYQAFDEGDKFLARIYRDVFQRQIGSPTVSYDDRGEPEDYRTVTYRWRCIAGATRAEVWRAASRAFYTYCQHEHDCCGHVYYSVSDVIAAGGREWIIKVSGGRNV